MSQFIESSFTGKERDSESGNDYFGARYYASSMGRFMSPDWSAQEEPVPYAKMDDPQSLNLYAYVRNNPLTRVDADGHDGPDCGCPALPQLQMPQLPSKEQVLAVGTAVVALGVVGVKASWNNFTSLFSSGTEQGRDAQGKFLPTTPGQTQPGAAGEKEGLAAEGATKNTQPIPGSTRIPDGTKADGQYVEVKSGGTVSNTGQLKEMGKAAVAETGKPLVVVTTNPNATVTKPAQQNPDLVHKPLNQ